MNVSIVSKLKPSDAGETGIPTELVLKPDGDLCYENAHHVVEAVSEMLAHSPQKVSLELHEDGIIDSSGLRALLQSRKLCEEAGVAFELESISDYAARVIRMSGFEDVFGLGDSAGPSFPPPPNTELTCTTGSSHSFECVAASDPALIAPLREKVANAAAEAGAAGDTLCDITIAVGEALTNAYKHGSPNKGVSRILLRCHASPASVIVEVEDQGAPFDPNATPTPDPRRMQPNGMGLFLIRETMDVVEFRSNCPGNVVRMIRYLKQ